MATTFYMPLVLQYIVCSRDGEVVAIFSCRVGRLLSQISRAAQHLAAVDASHLSTLVARIYSDCKKVLLLHDGKEYPTRAEICGRGARCSREVALSVWARSS